MSRKRYKQLSAPVHIANAHSPVEQCRRECPLTSIENKKAVLSVVTAIGHLTTAISRNRYQGELDLYTLPPLKSM